MYRRISNQVRIPRLGQHRNTKKQVRQLSQMSVEDHSYDYQPLSEDGRAEDGFSSRIPSFLPFLAAARGGRSTSRIAHPHPRHHCVQGKADQGISNQHCCPSTLPAHIFSAGKELVLGISSLLISHIRLSFAPRSLISARGYWTAHRFMSRKSLRHPSAFADFYFPRLFHLLPPTVPLLSATSTSTPSTPSESSYRNFQKRGKLLQTSFFLPEPNEGVLLARCVSDGQTP